MQLPNDQNRPGEMKQSNRFLGEGQGAANLDLKSGWFLAKYSVSLRENSAGRGMSSIRVNGC